MAPVDIVEAEAEVARNQETVILAEAQLARAEDVLRALILDPAAPDFWAVCLQPTDPPRVGLRPIDVDETIPTAIERRADIDQLRADREHRHERPVLREPAHARQSTYSSTTRSPTSAVGGSAADPGSPEPVIGE